MPQVVVVGPLADTGDLGIGRSRRVQLSERRQTDQSRGVVLRSFSEPAHRDLNGSRRMYKMATWRLATGVIDDSGRRWWVVSSAVGPAVRATTTATTRDGPTVLKSKTKGLHNQQKEAVSFSSSNTHTEIDCNSSTLLLSRSGVTTLKRTSRFSFSQSSVRFQFFVLSTY